MSADVERRIVELAQSQHGLASRQQLIEIGLTRRAIERRLHHHTLRPVQRVVYVVGPLVSTWAREMAAVLAFGPQAVLASWTALKLRDLPLPDVADVAVVHVILPLTSSGRRPGVRVHRSGDLQPTEVQELHGMPATSPARSLLDVAPQLDRSGQMRRLEQLVAAALDQGLLTEGGLRTYVQARARHRGARLLQTLLAAQGEPALTRSEAEDRLLQLLRASRLEPPRLNARVAGYEVDFLWRSARLVVEVDGYAWHSSRQRFESDRARDGALIAAGYTVLRVTWRQLQGEPHAILGRIALTLGRLGAR
jgi:very-short-patch-repair endonuclease